MLRALEPPVATMPFGPVDAFAPPRGGLFELIDGEGDDCDSPPFDDDCPFGRGGRFIFG